MTIILHGHCTRWRRSHESDGSLAASPATLPVVSKISSELGGLDLMAIILLLKAGGQDEAPNQTELQHSRIYYCCAESLTSNLNSDIFPNQQVFQ